MSLNALKPKSFNNFFSKLKKKAKKLFIIVKNLSKNFKKIF